MKAAYPEDVCVAADSVTPKTPVPHLEAAEDFEAPGPMFEPQQDRSHESARRLLDAAAEIVAERGYDGATIAEIGKRAGYSRGLVSTRFGSKENLMWALVQRATSAWFDQLASPPPGGTGLERILHLIDAIGNHAASDTQTLRVLERLIFDASRTKHDLQARFVASQATMEANFASLFLKGMRDHSIGHRVNAKDEAALLVASMRGISYQWFLYPERVDILKLHAVLGDQLRERLAR